MVQRTLAAAAASLLLFTAVDAAQDTRKIDTSAKAVVAAAVSYVAAYQKDMAFVLADEAAAQHVAEAAPAEIVDRRTRAEFFLTYLPTDGVWISVRDVREVDGRPSRDGDDIRTLIQRAPLARLASVIAQKNSRFNIGGIRRTFNEPTFGLLMLNPLHQRRFKFDRVSVSQGPSPIVTLSFKERDRPTLIAGTAGEPVYTFGQMDVEAATGRIERTRVEMILGSVHATITTAYAPDAKLNMWVPVIMAERYEQTAGERRQTITVDSEYSNYRRFDASVVIR